MEIWTNQKGGQRRVKPVLLPLGWFRRWFYEHWQRSKGLKWPLTINFSRVARGRKRLPRNEPERRDNESRNNERRGWLGGKRREKEKRSGGREREREGERGGGKTMGAEAKPPLLQSTATMDSQTDTLCLLFYRSVSFYYRGEILVQIKASFANFRP